MAISAQRFKFLDNETNLPIKEFTEVLDNAVYNIQDLTETALSEIANKTEIMNTLENSLSELTSMLENNEILDTLKDALNSAIDSISNIELPNVVKDIFDFLKNLDLGGVKDFFKDMLKVGTSILCNNLDFLKNFLLGISLNPNILAGLIIALLLSWLDRLCKEFTKEDQKNMSNDELIYTMFPTKALSVDSDSVFAKFTNLYSDFLKASDPISLSTPISPNDFLNNVISGNITNSLLNLRNSEISSSDRDNYLSVLETNISSYSPGSTEFINILKAKGDLLNMPLISIERIDKNIRFSNLSDKLGSYLKQLPSITINNFTANTLSIVEQSLFNKMKELKSVVSNNSSIYSIEERSFDNFDFGSILPPLTTQEKDYLDNLKYDSESHKDGDIHPTTKIFYA